MANSWQIDAASATPSPSPTDLGMGADHLLAMPTSHQDVEAAEQAYARRMVCRRLSGQARRTVLQALGLESSDQPERAPAEIPEEKACSKCRRTLPLTDYPPDRRTRDGRTARCRACAAAYSRTYWRRRQGATS